MISKFDEIMERPIDDGYEENVRVIHNDGGSQNMSQKIILVPKNN